LAGVNVAAYCWPEIVAFGNTLRLFDVVGALATLALSITILRSILANTRQLLALEGGRRPTQGRRLADESGRSDSPVAEDRQPGLVHS